MRTAKKFGDIKFSSVIRIADRVRELERSGKKIIKLETGEPHVASPEVAVDAAIEALRAGQTHYSHSRGLPALRAAIAETYHKRFGDSLDADHQVLITPGGKQALLYALMSLLEAGDEVIIPSPGWVSYEEIVKIAGGAPVLAGCEAGQNFAIRYEAIASRITPKTKAVIVNSPNNPTGAILDRETLSALIDLCNDRDIALVSDEIYDQLIFRGNTHVSALALNPSLKNLILVNGFSKTYAMTGWRLGYVIAQDEIIDVMLKIQQNSVTCPATFIQYGAIAALEHAESFATKTRALYQTNIDYLQRSLASVPMVRLIPPQGGLYAFIDVSNIRSASMEFAMHFLNEEQVSVTPGVAFGPHGEGFIRVCIATDIGNLKQFIARLRSFAARA